jgi:hypothetical protein
MFGSSEEFSTRQFEIAERLCDNVYGGRLEDTAAAGKRYSCFPL